MSSLSRQFTRATRSIPLYTSCSRRMFYSSPVNSDLVAPPDPVSNLRPILYDNASNTPTVPNVRHPYSLSEFTPAAVEASGDHELQFKLLRQQLDTFNQVFWTDVRLASTLSFALFTQCFFRAIPDFMLPKPLFSKVYPLQFQFARKKMHFPRCTRSG